MSYMDDDCDPFGIPYSKVVAEKPVKKVEENMGEINVEYDLKAYVQLLEEKKEFKKALGHLNDDIKLAEKSLLKKIRKRCGDCKVTFENEEVFVEVSEINFLKLTELMKELDLVDIRIKKKYDKLKLILMW